MAIAQTELENLLRTAFPDAEIAIEDLAGDGDHYRATVRSDQFAGKARVAQHQMVYAALKGRMGDQLHALALQTGPKTST
jgi:stress-induced morphogen